MYISSSPLLPFHFPFPRSLSQFTFKNKKITHATFLLIVRKKESFFRSKSFSRKKNQFFTFTPTQTQGPVRTRREFSTLVWERRRRRQMEKEGEGVSLLRVRVVQGRYLYCVSRALFSSLSLSPHIKWGTCECDVKVRRIISGVLLCVQLLVTEGGKRVYFICHKKCIFSLCAGRKKKIVWKCHPPNQLLSY